MIRLVAADFPHDIACTVLVLPHLDPATNVLAYSRAKARDESDRHEEAVRAMISTFPWDAVVDISDLPMQRHWSGGSASRWRRTSDMAKSRREMRSRLAAAVGLDPS